MKKPLFGPSLEMIAFQSTVFGEMLTGIVEDIRSDVKSGKLKTVAQMEKALGAITHLVKSQTNLTIKVSYLDSREDADTAAMRTPIISLNHIFNRYSDIVNYIEHRDTDAIISNLKKFKDEDNWVDTKNVRVNGAFASIENILYLGSNHFLTDYLSAQELVATILHEIGHTFYSFAYMDRTSTTNQMLAAFAMEEFQQLPAGKRKVIFQKAEIALRKTGLRTLPLDQLSEAKSSSETTTIFLTSVLDDNRSHTDTPYYDYRACEALADNFCARHGFAKHLVTALAKNMGEFNKSMYVELARLERKEAISVLVTGPLVAGLGVLGVAVGVGVLPSMVLVFIGAVDAVMGGMELGKQQSTYYAHNKELYFSYDDLKVRLQRIREQVVTQLKTPIPKKLVNKLIKDLSEIDELIADTPLPPPTFITKLSDFFSSSRSKARDYRALQRLLEEFAANDLFINAAKLKSIQ